MEQSVAQQPAQSQPASKPPPPERVAAIVAALTGAAAAGAATGAAVAPLALTAGALSRLVRLLGRWGYRRETIKHTVRTLTSVVTVAKVPAPEPGPAARANLRNEPVFTAWFLERTTERVEAGYAAGVETPEDREARFLEQHLEAQRRRRDAARRIDTEAEHGVHVTDRDKGADGVPGDPDGLMDGTAPRIILKWRAHPDDKTTPECAAADGAWFYADTPPIIGYPGMPHGGTCRCWPAHAGSRAEVVRGRHVNEAVRDIIRTEPDHRTHPGATRPGRRTA